MAVRIKNLTSFPLAVPSPVNKVIRAGGAIELQYVEWDAVVNVRAIVELIEGKHLLVKNLDAEGVRFDSAWNAEEKFHMGDYHIWVDESGSPRINYGDATSDSDGSAFGGVSHSPILFDSFNAAGRNFTQLRLSFFNNQHNMGMGTWDTLYKYCYWEVINVGSTTWHGPQKFDTQNDFFTWIESVINSTGGIYDNAFFFKLYEVVDTTDTFPQRVVHRNSLVASILGRGRWVYRHANERSGVSTEFNAPAYYTNFYNELGRRFVIQATGNTPIGNQDGVVWFANQRKTKWNLPKVGSTMDVVAVGARGAMWDDAAVSWVVPCQPGTYVLQEPFLLYENRKSRTLAITNTTSPWRRQFELNAITALVYPAVRSARYYGFLVYPLNADCFATEWFDTADYELVLKLSYNHTNRPVYEVLTPYTLDTTNERLMWSHFPQGGGNSTLLQKLAGGSAYWSNIDTNIIPSRVFACRRNKTTGVRSKWYPLYNIRRRVPHVNYRVEPARYKK